MEENYQRITSASNQIIKEVRELADKKGRMKSGAFVVEGMKLAAEAFANRISVRYAVVADSLIARFEQTPHPNGLSVYNVPDDLFARISSTESPQGILIVADIPSIGQEAAMKNFSRYVVLENVQDPGNVGTIIRAADACGFDGVLLSSGCADPFNPKVLRSAMGSIFHIPVVTCNDIYGTVAFLKARGIRTAAAHPRDAEVIWKSNLAQNIAIVIGNEGNGLSDMMLELTDIRVMIPMPGKAESFNAASATSILLYESMRQKLSD